MSSAHNLGLGAFFAQLAKGRLVAARCKACRHLILPPRPICPFCRSRALEQVELDPSGRVLTFSEVHVPSRAFSQLVPYVVAIVELSDQARLPGIIKGVKRAQVQVGMRVRLMVEAPKSESWPHWPRYFFVPGG